MERQYLQTSMDGFTVIFKFVLFLKYYVSFSVGWYFEKVYFKSVIA